MAQTRLILERTADAIRRQDWFAVIIEFALVVAGVLFAFQVDEWANEYEASRERSAAVERLLDEAEETVAFFRGGVTAQKQLTADLGYALQQVQSGSWETADRARMTRGLSRAIEATTPSPPSSVYDDLVSSGVFGKLGDLQLRSAIARYRATLQFHRESIEYLRQMMPQFEETRAFHYAYSSTEPLPARLSVDFAALERDGVLQEKLATLANRQRIFLVLRERNLKRAIEMCREIARVARRACDLHRPLPNFD